MKHLPDALTAAIAALAITFVDRFFVSGPYMGLAGIALSVIAAFCGWYLARALSGLTAGRASGGYTMLPLASFTVFGALIFAAIAYVKIFDMTKTDYTAADVAAHLFLVALATFTIRMASISVNRLAG
jgi:predicted permease